ncbi:hypothetical protein [Kocuria sp. HSID16901]|uniref:hypothetical protein n=1 Tax=Kocuria sp. HSID16901 TaxID=2419505 RepID=UPI000F88728B|nr:hypothetical protein [Kocuria sp. HSID16901]RUQ19838.1 hypothetical protein D8M21_10985 [Kocuria sp. HSID16901]
MKREIRTELEERTQQAQAAQEEALGRAQALNDAIVDALNSDVQERGDQRIITDITGFSREYLRTLTRTYYRSIIRRGQNGEAWISMPSNNVHAHVDYEIRAEDKKTVLARVKGQQLLDERQDQLTRYRAAKRGRTNIALVDVSLWLS